MMFKELENLNQPKFYKQAPLPFMGQKKNFLELFRKTLAQKEVTRSKKSGRACPAILACKF